MNFLRYFFSRYNHGLKVCHILFSFKIKSKRKPKTGDRIAAISRLVPGAGQFSNPLFANLNEFRALKESLNPDWIL